MSKPLVILDAGHNEYVDGKEAVDKSLREWVFNNNMQYLIKEGCERHGMKVCLTNPNPEKKNEIGLSLRRQRANNFYTSNGKPSNTIYISIHANAHDGSKWTEARGTETYIPRDASQKSKNFANLVNTDIYNYCKSIDSGAKNRGVKVMNFAVIRNTLMPCALIEYAFYTNKSDLHILKTKQKELAEVTVKAICKHFGIEYKAKAEEKKEQITTNNNVFYRVVAGSYSDRANANKEIGKLKKDGINAFLLAFVKDGKTYFRVIAGSYNDRSNADEQVEKLKAKGYNAFIAVYNK